jgi:hypothetical protein
MQQTTTQPWGVKGLTESPRAPIVAKAKIGEKGDRGQPKRLDYIIFVEPQTGRRLPEYQAVFGEKPTSFAALLAADTVENMVDVAWKRFGKKGLKCRGDGDRGYDRETGEARECAGEYNFQDPTQHACPFARPNGDKPAECKPILSMRLVVPQIPGLGVVQLDTGGVASSIPTLIAQLRMIENMTRDRDGHPHMAGIAVKVLIRAFRDRFGNAAYSWQLEPLMESDASALRSNIEGLVRIEGQVNMTALPPMDETPDADIYGITEAPEERQIEAGDHDYSAEDGAEMDAAGQIIADQWTPQTAGDEPDFGVPGEVVAAELAYREALGRSPWPEAKRRSKIALMEVNRTKASETGNWSGYVDWLTASTDAVPGGES